MATTHDLVLDESSSDESSHLGETDHECAGLISSDSDVDPPGLVEPVQALTIEPYRFEPEAVSVANVNGGAVGVDVHANHENVNQTLQRTNNRDWLVGSII